MKGKKLRTLLIALAAAAILWAAMLGTDCARCRSLRAPLFAFPTGVTADDGGSGLYRGAGYTVELEVHIDAELGRQVERAVLRLGPFTPAAAARGSLS